MEVEFAHELTLTIDDLVGSDRYRVPHSILPARVIDDLFILAGWEMLLVHTQRRPAPGPDDVDRLSDGGNRGEDDEEGRFHSHKPMTSPTCRRILSSAEP